MCKKSEPIAIITADIHLTAEQPICRKDNYKEAMITKLKFIRAKQKELDIPVIDAGDVFNRAKPNPEVISMALRYLPRDFITIAGNHDLSYHNNDIFEQTALYAVSKAKTGVTVLKPYETLDLGNLTVTGFPYGYTDVDKVDKTQLAKDKPNVALIHIMTYKGDKPFPMCSDPDVGDIEKKFSMFDNIITGHNHQCFYTDKLLNAGSLMRSRADQIDYKPRLWYLCADGTFDYEYIPIDETAVSNEHTVEQNEIDSRMQSYVSSLNNTSEISFSFEDNLNRFIEENHIDNDIKSIITNAMEEN